MSYFCLINIEDVGGIEQKSGAFENFMGSSINQFDIFEKINVLL
jgi:hypothetical protein